MLLWRAGVLTAVAEVVRVHEGDGHGLLRVQSALISITAIHGVHHVCHFLTGVPDGILALLGQLPDNPMKERINEDLLLWETASFHPSPSQSSHMRRYTEHRREKTGMIQWESFSSVVKDNFEEYFQISGCDSEK